MIQNFCYKIIKREGVYRINQITNESEWWTCYKGVCVLCTPELMNEDPAKGGAH